MAKHYEHTFKVQSLFFDYLKNNDLDTLIKGLYKIETLIENVIYQHSNNIGDKSLWFKFFEDDTAATTISNIKADLSLPKNHPNHKNMIECLKLSIHLYGEIEIYYS